MDTFLKRQPNKTSRDDRSDYIYEIAAGMQALDARWNQASLMHFRPYYKRYAGFVAKIDSHMDTWDKN